MLIYSIFFSWEQRKLNEFTRYISSNLSISDSINNGKYNLYDANNIIGKVNSKNISEEFITIIKDGSGVGKVRRLHKNSCFIGTMGGILSKESDIDFIYCCLLNTDFTKEINGATIPHIYYSNYGNNEYYVPKYLEQSKLGDLFTNLDNLITLHQRKSNVYVYSWEQRELFDVADYRNGKAHENDIDDDGKYIVVNSKFVSTEGKTKKYSNKQNEPLFKNEIAFVLSDVPNGRAIAKTFLVDKSSKYTLNQRIAGITPHSNINPKFLSITMNRNRYFLQFDDGVKQTNLSLNDMKKFEEFYPNKLEQDKIGELFTNLDNLITLHQCKKIKERSDKNKYLRWK